MVKMEQVQEVKEKKIRKTEVVKTIEKTEEVKKSVDTKKIKKGKKSKSSLVKKPNKEATKKEVESKDPEKVEKQISRKEPKANDILLFDRWDSEDVEIKDMGLAQYMNVKNILVPNAHGRHAKKQFYKSDLNIVERLMNRMYVAGHRGKKHKIFSGQNIGKSQKLWGIIEDSFEIIENQTKKNPVQILVTAIENSAPKEEVITYQRGGQMARKPVVVSSQRRIDLALRMLTQGAYENRLNNKMTAAESLAKDIIAASKNERCKAIMERERREKEAKGAR